MDHNIPGPRPTKRARIRDSSDQWSFSANSLFPEAHSNIQQVGSARTETPHIQYQSEQSASNAPKNKEPILISNASSSVSTETSSQWWVSAHHYTNCNTQSLNFGQSAVSNFRGYLPAQSSLNTRALGISSQLWQPPVLSNGHEPTSRHHFPSLEPCLPAMVNEGNNAQFIPPSVSPAHHYRTNFNPMPSFTRNPSLLLPQPTAPQSNDEPVCFGMIQQLIGSCDLKSSSAPAEVLVRFHSSDQFMSIDDGILTGRLNSNHNQMIHGLLEEGTLELFVCCIIGKDLLASKSAHSLRIWPCSLEVTVYGPINLLEDIGDWFQEQDVHLQDPRLCYRDTKYCNPQKLSTSVLETCPLVSDVTTKKTVSIEMQAISPQPTFLDALKSRDDLREAQQPTIIRSVLKKHQKQALTFMIQRERGWAFGQEYIDLWEAHKSDHGIYFINKVSNAYQDEEPPEFRGGIIADTMGLGKTLTMIALVAADLDIPAERVLHISSRLQSVPEVGTTLIIIPPPLLDTWEEQLSEHVFGGCLQWCRHHSKTRITNLDEISSQHIVLTTYHTVSAEWKGHRAAQNSPLYSVQWKRIILDEAHFIRNVNSTMAKAVCALPASSRWAVTGTPVQNRLSDLASLLKFIRANPYNDTKQFETDISSLWKAGEDEEAAKRLQYLSACLLLRRAKGAIDLPSKTDLLCPVDFPPEERTAYEALRQQAIHSIDEAVSGNHLGPGVNVYANALQRIESLRLFCNLGLQYNARHEPKKGHEWSSIAQQAFNSRRGMEAIVCTECSLSFDFTESLLDEPGPSNSGHQFSSCMRFICSECTRKLNRDRRKMECGHKPACPVASVSTGNDAFEEIPDTLSAIPTSSTNLSSKVDALIADLNSLPLGTKCVVFSTWRLTLDLVKAGLDRNSIPCVRFDGKVPQNERGGVVTRFRTDPAVRVMLLTLSCGAVGLTLTAASRAYLMEPHWNPTLEEQALARIHRLGQTKPVTTVRLYMRDSFEEEVIKVQRTKKQLANVLLLPHDGGSGGDNLETLQGLRSLL